MPSSRPIDFQLGATERILVTSEAGKRLSEIANVEFVSARASEPAIQINPLQRKQTLYGIGSSFTEASAFVLAHLPCDQRAEVMAKIYSAQGANLSLARVPIGSCDFCVFGCYSYADKENDTALDSFDISVDADGFDPTLFPGIRDSKFDLLQMINEAQSIKQAQLDPTLNIIASAWTAPAWMKDIQAWYQPPAADNDFQGTGGRLLPQHYATFANYLVRYLDRYREQGIEMWGMTPVNEPYGNNGQWESMHFSAEEENEFVKHHLGPALKHGGYDDLKLLIFDHNREQIEEWTDLIYNDPKSADYVSGAAVHWYGSTDHVYQDVFERVHARFPDYLLIHSEGCIDDLGNPAPEGIGDPVGFQETGWFDNDAFWWQPNATDWAYTASWPGVDASLHPQYVPVHRYARDIIVGIDHWLNGWIDWNIVLDRRGGPNHVGNHCGAPIMIDTATGHVYYTPIYYILSQLSQTIRAGDSAVRVEHDQLHTLQHQVYSCATLNREGLLSIQIFNTARQTQEISIQIGQQNANVCLQANALHTIQVRLSL